MPQGAKIQGRQNGPCKNFTRVKKRSQARLHRQQTSSDSSSLVRTVGEGEAKQGTGQSGRYVARGASGGTRSGAHHLGAHQEVLLCFFDVFTHILKTTMWITVL